jgi:hypothetical protein
MIIFSISTIVGGNPIPVYPDPEFLISGTPGSYDVSINPLWITIVFVFNFALNLLIFYAGLYIIFHFHKIDEKYFSNFSRYQIILAVFLISIIGLITEFFFGTWIGGLFLVLVLVFISYVLVSKYILGLNFNNSTYLGLFATGINIVSWIVLFSIL